MFKLLSLVILILSGCFIGISAEDNAINDTKNLSENVMKNILKNDINSGVDLLRPHWGIEKIYIDKFLEESKKQLPNLSKKYGKDVGIEFIKTETIGKSFIRHTFLYKFEKHAVKWTFTFYISKDKWEVNNLNFDENLEPLYKERSE